jgi:phospholipase C
VYVPVAQSEHPPGPVAFGESAAQTILGALTSNQSAWARTALFITWDENGGFFDHVVPPTPPRGTQGEHIGVRPLPAPAEGIGDPIGLGFRVPTLVVSPFSRGGFVCSEVFDHTSLLRFIEARFGVEVPNLSAWRRAAVGDLRSAFDFSSPDDSLPTLPGVSLTPVVAGDCSVTAVNGVIKALPVGNYPVPPNSLPTQESGPRPARRLPSSAVRPPGRSPAPSAHPRKRRKRRRHHHHHRRHRARARRRYSRRSRGRDRD